MTTYFSHSNLPSRAIKCTPILLNKWRWETVFYNGPSSAYSVDCSLFLPSFCHPDTVEITEEDFNLIKSQVLSELNLMILPIQKTCTVPFDVSLLVPFDVSLLNFYDTV